MSSDESLNGYGNNEEEFDDLIEIDGIDYDHAPDDESIISDTVDTYDQIDENLDYDPTESITEAVDMSIATYFGHSTESNNSVYCVAINKADPTIVMTGGGDDNAYIWQFDQTGVKCLFALKGHTDSVTTVGFNFDNTLALTAGLDGKIMIWDLTDGSLKLVLEGPEDCEWAEWHSKGNAVIAGSRDGTCWMWLANNGQCVQVFAGHDGAVTSGCFTKDGKSICTGGDDGSLRIWAPKSGLCKLKFDGHNGHQGTVTCIVSSEDGDLVLTGAVDGKMRLYQISGKKLLQTFVHVVPKLLNPAEASILSDNMDDESKFVKSADIDGYDDDDDLTVAEVETTVSVESVGFCNCSDLKWIASGGMDSTLKVWDLMTGVCRSVCSHDDSVIALKWHQSLPIIVTAALDNILRLWDARNGSLLCRFTGHNNLILNFDMHPFHINTASSNTQPDVSSNSNESGNFSDVIVTVSDDGTAKVFMIHASQILATGGVNEL